MMTLCWKMKNPKQMLKQDKTRGQTVSITGTVPGKLEHMANLL